LGVEAARIGERYDQLIETSEEQRRYLPEDRARAGCVVTIGEDGEFEIYAGLIERSPGDTDTADIGDDDVGSKDRVQSPPASPSPEQVARKDCGYSQSLIDDLKAHRQQITRAHLAGNFDVAFDLALYTLCADLLARRSRHGSLSLRASETYLRSSLKDLRNTPADRLLEACKRSLPRTWLALPDSQRFTALAALPAEEKQRLFAWCVAAMLEPQLGFEDKSDAALELAGERLAIPFADYWRPTAANYWGRVKKAHALEVAGDVLGPRWAKDHADDKKTTLATALEAAFDAIKQAGTIGLDPTAREKAAEWLPVGMPYAGVGDGSDSECGWAEDDTELEDDEAEVPGDDAADLPAFLGDEELAA
jgi:ParB family chromosome partitioning protein